MTSGMADGAADILDNDDGRDHHNGDDDDDDPEEFACPIEFSLKWRSLVRCLLQEPRDASHFGLHPGRRHDGLTVSVSRGRPAEHHVVSVAERHVIRNDVGILGDRQAFAGQRGLSGLEGCRFQ